MDYEYALLEKQRIRHINCSPCRDHNVDYRRAHSTERSSNDLNNIKSKTWFITHLFSLEKHWFLSQSVQSGIRQYHRLNGLWNLLSFMKFYWNLFLIVLEAGRYKTKVPAESASGESFLVYRVFFYKPLFYKLTW